MHISPIGYLGEKWWDHLVNLFWFLVLCRGRHIYHAHIVFIIISLADICCNHGRIIIISQHGKLAGLVVPWLVWDMISRYLKFYPGKALDWLVQEKLFWYRLHRCCLWPFCGSEGTCL